MGETLAINIPSRLLLGHLPEDGDEDLQPTYPCGNRNTANHKISECRVMEKAMDTALNPLADTSESLPAWLQPLGPPPAQERAFRILLFFIDAIHLSFYIKHPNLPP